MGYIEGEDRKQTVLFPEVLDNYISEENAVRFIDVFIEGLDLSELGFLRRFRKRRDGRHMILGIFYGYMCTGI
jgi:transposase